MGTEYEDIEDEKKKFNEFRETAPQIVLEVYVLPKRGVVIVRHRTHYNQPSQLIAAAFPHAGEEAQKYVSIQASHHGREVMNELGKNTMYSVFTNKEWNCDRFVIIPLSEKSRIQKLLFMPHVERISASDAMEAEEIYEGLVAHNEYGAYDHRKNLKQFGLKPKQVAIDVMNHSITINAEGDSDVGRKLSLGDFLRNLEIMGFKNVKLNLNNTNVFFNDFDSVSGSIPADFSKPHTWLPRFENPIKISVDIASCRNVGNSSDITTYQN